VPAIIADAFQDADVLLTLKSQEKRQPKRLREAGHRGLPTHIIKSNTLSQIEGVLRAIFGVQDRMSPEEAAMREAEEAISEVMAAAQPVELGPQNSYLRRLQHQLIQRYGLASESKGTDPFRRVVIYPQ
jgi:R3H domain